MLLPSVMTIFRNRGINDTPTRLATCGTQRYTAIFDMDGTLLETDLATNLAYLDALRALGLPAGGLRSCRRRIAKSDIRRLVSDEATLAEVARLKRRAYARHLGQITLGPAAVALRFVLANRQRFGKIVLLSDGEQDRVLQSLKHHNLDHCFDEIVCNAGQGDKYANYFACHDTCPETTLLWENETRQIRAARRAGIHTRHIQKVA